MRTLEMSIIALALALAFGISAQANEHEAPGATTHAEKSEHGADLNLMKQPVANKQMATWPSKVTLESPAALAKVSGGATTLKWSASTNADSYHLQIATDPNFKWLIANENFYKNTSYEVKGLEAGKQYFWRVAGMNSQNSVEYQKGSFVFSSFEAQ